MANIFNKFNSIKEFYNYLDTRSTQAGMSTASMTGEHSFTGTDSYEQATNLLLYGDKDLQKEIEGMGVAKLRAQLNKYRIKRQVYSSAVGFAPNVPNYIAGAPNSMIAMRQIKLKQNVVTVFYNCGVAGIVDASSIRNAVSNLCCALIRLEASGVRVNLYVGTLGSVGSASNKQYASFAVKIKDSGQPFDTLKMVYPLAHPSFNRRHKFRYIEVSKGINKTWAYGYGYSETDDDVTKKFLAENNLKVDKVFNYRSLEGESVDNIIKDITSNQK